MKRKALAAAALVLLLAGCGWQGTGTVTGTYHRGAWTQIVPGAKGTIIPIYHPPCYGIHLVDAEGQQHDVCINETTWAVLQPGQTLTIGEDK